MKKHITSIISFIGFAVALLGVVIDTLSATVSVSSGSSRALISLISQTTLYSFIGAAFAVCLINSDKNMTKNVGYALAGISGTYGLAIFLFSIKAGAFLLYALGLALLFVAALIYFLYVCICFFGFAKNKTCDSAHQNNDLCAVLGSYKELQQEKVLSESEYEALKEAALSEASGQKVGIDDLKKWKKMLDQNIITEEEFAALKAKVFGN